jgi:hypothetical protein
MQTKQSYSTLNEYKKAHSTARKNEAKQTITQYLDSLLLTKHTFTSLLKLCAEFNATHNTNDFRTVSRIKAHVRFRETHNNFVYEMNESTVKLVSTNRAEYEKAQNEAKNEAQSTAQNEAQNVSN